METRQAKKVFDALDPGNQPGNFAIGDKALLSDLMGAENAPNVAFGLDIDDAITEDPSMGSRLGTSAV